MSDQAGAALPAALETRAELLERLERETFDIAIVGGGINGAGIARDAAMRGLTVALLEKGDFASGASGRSSRLIHGGLRYLRHRQVSLVREALRERGRLVRLAPHLVRRLPFVLPLYDDGGENPLVLRLGLFAYDLLAGGLGIGRHRALSRDALVREEPHLRKDGLLSGLRYFDAVTEDDRLTLVITMSALRYGAVAVNYVEAAGLEKTEGRVAGVQYRDLAGTRQGTVKARVVVSAAGPWTDEVRSLAGEPGMLRPTKGVHVVVPRDRLRTEAAVAFAFEGRMLFAIPHDRHTYIGTTDTDYTGDPGEAEADRDDVSYVLDAANGVFETGLAMADVVATWAGVRPLLDEDGKPSSVSRDYTILDGPPGLVTITGGKLTTYRSMAEHLVDHVIEGEGNRLQGRPARSRTAHESLPGGDISDIDRYEREAGASIQRKFGVSEDAARRLVKLYGTEHANVLALAEERPELLVPLAPGSPALAVEAAYAASAEMALTLEDFMRRRSGLMLFGNEGDPESAAARVMAGVLGWSAEEMDRQLAEYRDAAGRMMAFSGQAGDSDGSAAGEPAKLGGGDAAAVRGDGL